MKDPLDYLTYDDLPESLQHVAHYCGMDVARTLIRHMPGEEILIPAVKRIPGVCQRFVASEFTGENVRQLARALRSSQSHVRNYLSKGEVMLSRTGATPRRIAR